MIRTILNIPRLIAYSAAIAAFLVMPTLASAEADSKPSREVPGRDPSSVCGPAHANMDLSPFALDQWTPPRITARTSHKGPEPPAPNLNSCYGFSGFNLSSLSKTRPYHTSVWITPEESCAARQHRYKACYSSLQLGTLFPVLGSMYCVDSKTSAVSARRLRPDEIPPGITLRRDTYVFPLLRSRPYRTWNSGKLHDCMILVGYIGTDSDDPAKPYAKLVITASPTDEGGEAWKDMSEMNWQIVHVGDVLDFKGRQHRVTNIVPPNDTGFEIRGRNCKMIGWIELENEVFEASR